MTSAQQTSEKNKSGYKSKAKKSKSRGTPFETKQFCLLNRVVSVP